MKIKHKQFNFLIPLAAIFILTLSAVIALLSVGGEETVYYLNQLNFTPDPKTVCIDAGHGGTETGAMGESGKRLEKNDNLRLALLVRDELVNRGYTVVMTRDSDATVSLEDRCKIANKAKAALFVSIHRNSTSGSGRGCEMWIHSKNPSDDRLLAENILQNLELAGADTSRGIHTGYREGADKNYYVNRCSKMPSVLAEIGFISSKEDNAQFDGQLDVLAAAIADGIEMTLLKMKEFNAWDYGISPETECGEAIEKLISLIPRDSSEKVIRFQDGTYYIKAENVTERMLYITNTAGDREYSKKETPHKAAVALYFDGLENLTVDGGGAKFIISGKATSCVISKCKNFVLENITIDADKPDFHSLKVVAAGKRSVDFELDENEDFEFRKGTVVFKGDGFETDIKHKAKMCWWANKVSGENREINVRARHPLATALKLKMADEKTLRAFYLSTARFNKGDIYYIFDNRRQYAGIFIDSSTNVTLQNVAQHFNYSLAVVCQCSEDIFLKELDFTPKKGCSVTSVADFVQACLCRGQFSVTDCVFDGAGDDCLNCHGFHFKVESVNGNKAYVKFMHPQSHGYNPFRDGDKAAFIDKKTLLQIGECEAVSSKLISETEIELTLSGDMPKKDTMLENVSACPALYFARNEIHRIATRGLLITTRGKTVVEDNHFYRNGMSGVLFSDDASSWYESGMCTDVTVRNNIFDYCGEHGIMIKPENSVHGGAVHRNIKVLNNTFKKCEKECFYAKSASNLKFINNKVESAPELLKTVNCENVTVE